MVKMVITNDGIKNHRSFERLENPNEQKLTDLPAAIFQSTLSAATITEIDISHSNFVRFPAEVTSLKTLKASFSCDSKQSKHTDQAVIEVCSFWPALTFLDIRFVHFGGGLLCDPLPNSPLPPLRTQ